MTTEPLVQVESVATGVRVWLPHEVVDRMAALGRVRRLAPEPDPRYGPQASRLDLSDTWQGGRFIPGDMGGISGPASAVAHSGPSKSANPCATTPDPVRRGRASASRQAGQSKSRA